MIRMLPFVLLTALPVPAAAQACFDASQCARDAIVMTRAISREVSLMSGEIRALRAQNAELSASLAQLRERIARLEAAAAPGDDTPDAEQPQEPAPAEN